MGIETAKNLILAGPGAVTLCDDYPTEVRGGIWPFLGGWWWRAWFEH